MKDESKVSGSRPTDISARSFYAGVFFASALLMCMQVIESRILSVTTWYHLSFLIISMAMFGLTLGAIAVHNGDIAAQRKNFAQLIGRAMVAQGIFMGVALLALVCVPIVS